MHLIFYAKSSYFFLLLDLLLFTLVTTTNGSRSCTRPPSVKNAKCFDGPVSSGDDTDAQSSYQPDDSIHYRCNDGFEMVGSSDVTCLSSGKWSSLPTCQTPSNNAVCQEPPTIDFGFCTLVSSGPQASNNNGGKKPTRQTTTTPDPSENVQSTPESEITEAPKHGGGNSQNTDDGDNQELAGKQSKAGRIIHPKMAGFRKHSEGRRQDLSSSNETLVFDVNSSDYNNETTITMPLAMSTGVPKTTAKKRSLHKKTTTTANALTSRGARKLRVATTESITSSKTSSGRITSTKTSSTTVASVTIEQVRDLRQKKTTTQAAMQNEIASQKRSRSQSLAKKATCKCQDNYILKGQATVTCVGQEVWSTLPSCDTHSNNPSNNGGRNSNGGQNNNGGGVYASANDILGCDQLPAIPGASCRKKVFSLLYGANQSDTEWIDMDPNSLQDKQRLVAEGLMLNFSVTTIARENSSATTTEQSTIEGLLRDTMLLKKTPAPGVGRARSGIYAQSRSSAGPSQIGDTYDCECKPGYIQQTYTSLIICMKNGQWSDLPSCRVAPTTMTVHYCGVPRTVDNAYLLDSSSSDETTTDANVDTSEQLASRQQIPVESLQSLMIMGGQRIRFACKPGYKMRGNPTVTCSSDGVWSNYPTCTATSCIGTPNLSFGKCGKVSNSGNGDIYQVGDQAKCSCYPGYKMSGLPVITCQQAPDQWSDTPECYKDLSSDPVQQSTCETPPNVDGSDCCSDGQGGNSQQVFHSGDTITYTCQPGYQMDGDPMITCDGNGFWTNPPSCISQSQRSQSQRYSAPAMVCSSPRTVRNAYCNCEETSVNAPDLQPQYYVGDQICRPNF